MEIKTFEAFSMKDAVKALKKDFGSDAVILSTKEKPSPTGQGKIFEVTAAHSSRARTDGAQTASSDVNSLLEPILNKISIILENMPTKRTVENTESGINDLKLYLLQVLKSKEGTLFDNLPNELISVEKHLRVMGFSDTNIIELLKHVQGLISFDTSDTRTLMSEDQVRHEVCKWLYKHIRILPKWRQDQGHEQFKVILGPHGSGKTSLICKLASYYSKKERTPVAILSIDQSRIAATEQMRVFCRIIGIPFYAASSADELKGVIKSLDSKLVFVDTSGFSCKDRNFVTNLKGIFQDNYDVEYHLCLSNTEKESHNERFIQSALPIGISSISFTKIDESLTYGELFNLSKKWSLPIAYFSYGPMISEDFERASKERVIERLFGNI